MCNLVDRYQHFGETLCFGWFLAWLILLPWRWKRYVHRKCRVFSELHRATTQRTMLVKSQTVSSPLLTLSDFNKLCLKFFCIWVTSVKKNVIYVYCGNSRSLDRTCNGMQYTSTCQMTGLAVNVLIANLCCTFCKSFSHHLQYVMVWCQMWNGTYLSVSQGFPEQTIVIKYITFLCELS
jgi:hypothetical protein